MLAIKPTLGSAIRIATHLSELTGKKCLVYTNGAVAKDVVIRYGNTSNNPCVVKYNSTGFIKICRNKLVFSKIMQDLEIASPIYYSDRFPEEYPVMIRESLSSTGGKGIHVVENFDEFNPIWNKGEYYWTPFRKTEFELRVHVLGGKVAKIFKKIWNGEGLEPEYPNRHNDDYHYSLRKLDVYPKLNTIVEKVKDKYGTENFYAIDVGWDSDKKEYFVFEFNSAPGINNNTARLFAEFFYERLK